MYNLNLSELNQGCGWWVFPFGRSMICFSLLAIWCVLSGLIRGKQGASADDKDENTYTQTRTTDGRGPRNTHGAGTKPGGQDLESIDSSISNIQWGWNGKHHPQMKFSCTLGIVTKIYFFSFWQVELSSIPTQIKILISQCHWNRVDFNEKQLSVWQTGWCHSTYYLFLLLLLSLHITCIVCFCFFPCP